jgi:hypothetical protein
MLRRILFEELPAATTADALSHWLDVADVPAYCWQPERVEEYDYGLASADGSEPRVSLTLPAMPALPPRRDTAWRGQVPLVEGCKLAALGALGRAGDFHRNVERGLAGALPQTLADANGQALVASLPWPAVFLAAEVWRMAEALRQAQPQRPQVTSATSFRLLEGSDAARQLLEEGDEVDAVLQKGARR